MAWLVEYESVVYNSSDTSESESIHRLVLLYAESDLLKGGACVARVSRNGSSRDTLRSVFHICDDYFERVITL